MANSLPLIVSARSGIQCDSTIQDGFDFRSVSRHMSGCLRCRGRQQSIAQICDRSQSLEVLLGRQLTGGPEQIQGFDKLRADGFIAKDANGGLVTAALTNCQSCTNPGACGLFGTTHFIHPLTHYSELGMLSNGSIQQIAAGMGRCSRERCCLGDRNAAFLQGREDLRVSPDFQLLAEPRRGHSDLKREFA